MFGRNYSASKWMTEIKSESMKHRSRALEGVLIYRGRLFPTRTFQIGGEGNEESSFSA